jgi:uncharacterized protein (DUF1015 family)
MNLYIADGHHRYETMLALRNQLAEANPGMSASSSANFGTLFVANMDDPGMVVLPTHRLIHSVEGFDGRRMLAASADNFDMHEVDATPAAIREALAKAERPAFAAVFPGNDKATLMVLREPPESLQGVLGELDVTVLHSLVLENVLGIDKAAQEAKTNIDYIKTDDKAMAALAAGKGQVCFMMRATPVSQVKACSDVGEFMPQKSTFFVPKIASGMVYRTIDADEELS